jgi:hypothetical protein
VPRKRQTYPPARTATKGPPRPGAGPEGLQNRPNLVAIDTTAGKGRDVSVGDRARIGGNGRYAGELVTIERVNAGVIPSAVVRNEAGDTRHVRTIDLEPVRADA